MVFPHTLLFLEIKELEIKELGEKEEIKVTEAHPSPQPHSTSRLGA